MSAKAGRKRIRGVLALTASMLLPWACTDTSDVDLVDISGSGTVIGQSYLDVDGSRSLTTDDLPLGGAEVLLRGGTSLGVVRTTVSDSRGLFRMEDVPVGLYRLDLSRAVIGDSLEVVGMGTLTDIGQGGTTRIDVGAGFPTLTLREALAAPPGRRVVTEGIALNPRVNFDDGRLHLSGDSTFLRALNVERLSLAPGDSVRLAGRVVLDNGRPALDSAVASIVLNAAALVVPVNVQTVGAGNANSGTLDAGLVRIGSAAITDTSTTPDGDFHFWAGDGSGPVEVVVRPFLGFNTAEIRPDAIVGIQALTGLLSPYDGGGGTVRWRLLPRTAGDIQLANKTADVSVATSLDPTSGSPGTVVELQVIVANLGTFAATGVQIEAAIPSEMDFVSSSQTTGSYSSGSGIWSVGRMATGTAHTLRLTMEIADPTPASVDFLARSLGLTFELDTNPLNDSASARLTIVSVQ